MRVQLLIPHHQQHARLDDRALARAEELEAMGLLGMDAFHLALAERAGVDVFLTTDDRFLRRAVRVQKRVRVRVENPLEWLHNVLRDH